MDAASCDEISKYEIQLKQVEAALVASKDSTEQGELQSLRNSLKELITLTKESLKTKGSGSSDKGNDSKYADEVASFYAELNNIESNSEHDSDQSEKTLKDNFESMIGQKCSAPHCHTWGDVAYHNAIICALDTTKDYNISDMQNFRLRVLYVNPTHKEMIPCPYFLDGECKFESDRCHFSHGELIPFGELREYKEPDFSKLKKNCAVLAEMQDKIWHKGRVVWANFDEKTCRIRLEQKKEQIDCKFEKVLPIFDEENSSESDDDDDDDDSYDTSDADAIRHANLVEKSLFSYTGTEALGEWEKHTKGIGSKLMQKMGYVVGTGLGSSGQGILVPVSAQILPAGRSLDYCMELREANGDADLFSVERKLEKEKKKREALILRNLEREKANTNVFTFLNDSIFSSSALNSESKSQKIKKDDFKNHSNKNLNVESLKISENIRKKEKQILKIKQSMQRQPAGSDIHNRLQSELTAKRRELDTLKSSESRIAREQSLRKDTNKISIF